jgi:hypothetical protein
MFSDNNPISADELTSYAREIPTIGVVVLAGIIEIELVSGAATIKSKFSKT